MYHQFFGLRERPFDLTSNRKYLLLTPKHQEALANLEYGLACGTGITVLLGEAGTGKTTLLHNVLGAPLRRSGGTLSSFVYLNNPTLSPSEFIECLAHEFQLGPDAARSKPRFLRELQRALAGHREKGVVSALIFDEAQSLPHALLEEVRLLANIESEEEKLLQIVLAGQPAFGDRLNEPAFRQLKQRIGLRCVLTPLDLRETAMYIAHRISVAGGNPARAFSRDAVLAIYERSGGIPRLINVICENALLTAFAADQQPAGAEIVREVCCDFDIGPARIDSPAAASAAVPRPSWVHPARAAASDEGRTRAVAPTSDSRPLFAFVRPRRR